MIDVNTAPVSRPLPPAHRVCLATNEDMMRHRNVDDPDHPERPARLQSILTRLSAWGLSDRCLRTPGQLRAAPEQLVPPHEPAHVAALSDTEQLSQSELDRLADRFNSVFLCPESYDCALLAAGCVVEAVDSVLSGESGSGLCVVRPPGHHAEPDTPHGFCLFNNVAVAARHAVSAHGLRRVMILDWDVHHGNGIQHMFYEDSDVLYMSLHRHDFGFFFPMSDDGDHDRVGSGPGAGFNVNVPWNRARMGAAEYLAALLAVVLPVGYQFSPELVLVSAGFDAARGDPLGGYLVPPEVYGHLTHHLTALAGGRVVVALEGGYNLTSISYSMAMCARALLGDPAVQLPPLPAVNDSAARTLCSVAHSQRPFWPAVAEPYRLAKEPLDVPESEPETKPQPEPQTEPERETKPQPEPQPEPEPLESLVGRLTLAEDQGTGAAAAVPETAAAAGDLAVEGSPERDAKPVTGPAERAAEASGLSEQGAVAAALAAGDAALQQFLVLEEISNQTAARRWKEPVRRVIPPALTLTPTPTCDSVCIDSSVSLDSSPTSDSAPEDWESESESAGVGLAGGDGSESPACPEVVAVAAVGSVLTFIRVARKMRLSLLSSFRTCFRWRWVRRSVAARQRPQGPAPPLTSSTTSGLAAPPSRAPTGRRRSQQTLSRAAVTPPSRAVSENGSGGRRCETNVTCWRGRTGPENTTRPAWVTSSGCGRRGPLSGRNATVTVQDVSGPPPPPDDEHEPDRRGRLPLLDDRRLSGIPGPAHGAQRPAGRMGDGWADLPVGGINASAPCADCGDSQENWVCLTCYQVCCGRYRSCHMLDHGAVTGHCMVLSLADLSVWCYVCENYIHHERLTAAKRSAHHSKFGVDMPGGDAGHA
ncbi:Histone deacetylase 6 [Amphibalanus amphitrite]|uniref:Histone deacetylase 6 n=1 Tax=Amphibalanus amphitrite TaxID=1232801 RepID=A0A6A4VFM9_AMPAM|nr:Histone deacetylase 6 [Amphibalanus amphitrite]